MNAQGGSKWLRFGLQISALVTAGSLGFLLATQPPTAAADALLPTTITVPSVPVSVPTVSLPTLTTPTGTTTSTSTTNTSTTTAPTAVQAAGAASGTAAAAGATAVGASGATATTLPVAKTVAERSVAGALRLSGGSISVPVESVVAPNGLRLVVRLAPRIVDVTKTLTATVRVRDARGYLVRGATVTVRSIPGGLLAPVAHKRSAADGSAGFVVRATVKALPRTGRLWLLVAATDPTRPKTVSASRALAVPIAARGH
jgi:hypothetical protein